jgi:lipoprotein-anchoring transpeptidase ErfK/SrfK
LRIGVSLVVIAFTLAGAGGEAAAQAYPPLLPGDYYPAPGASYPPPALRPYYGPPVPPVNVGESASGLPAGPYVRTPMVYRDASGAALQPYDPSDDERIAAYPPGPYSPADRPYFVPRERTAAPAPYGTAGMATLPPDDRPERGAARELPPQLHRQLVNYFTSEPAGTVIIDTPHTYLYLVLGGGRALRYGIGVGREGFTWSGTERISRMTEWPDWHPPKEMIERQPYLPRFMAGGEGNPLGARALYLGNTLYRIHGTNQPSTIGRFVSSGCIRLTNADIEDLYGRVNLGSRVVVLPGSPSASAAARSPLAR